MVEIKLRFEIYEKQLRALRLQKTSIKGQISSVKWLGMFFYGVCLSQHCYRITVSELYFDAFYREEHESNAFSKRGERERTLSCK